MTINLQGRGYDFEAALLLLSDLRAELEILNPGAVSKLEAHLRPHGHTVETLQEALVGTVPNIISINFDPEGSENHSAAVLQDIVDKISRLACRKRSSLLDRVGLVVGTTSNRPAAPPEPPIAHASEMERSSSQQSCMSPSGASSLGVRTAPTAMLEALPVTDVV